MSAPSDRTPDTFGSDPFAAARPGPPPTPEHRRPWAWIVVCGVLALALIGLTIWALDLNSDLDQQRDATAQAQQQADEAKQQADEANQQADQLSSDLDELGQSVSDAGDDLAQAGSDATESIQNALADIKSKLGSLADQIEPSAAGSESPEAGAESGGGEEPDPAAPAETATP